MVHHYSPKRMRAQRRFQPGNTGVDLRVVLAALMVISGCHENKAPPSSAQAIPIPSPQPSRQSDFHHVLQLAWSFEKTPSRCLAKAVGAGAALAIAVSRNTGVKLRLTFPGVVVSGASARTKAILRFRGPAGHWELQGSNIGYVTVSVESASDEVSLGRVLMLLDGGTLDVNVPGPALPSLRVPPAGANGTSWFDCARAQML
jgi:hypothetical protein